MDGIKEQLKEITEQINNIESEDNIKEKIAQLSDDLKQILYYVRDLQSTARFFCQKNNIK